MDTTFAHSFDKDCLQSKTTLRGIGRSSMYVPRQSRKLQLFQDLRCVAGQRTWTLHSSSVVCLQTAMLRKGHCANNVLYNGGKGPPVRSKTLFATTAQDKVLRSRRLFILNSPVGHILWDTFIISVERVRP